MRDSAGYFDIVRLTVAGLTGVCAAGVFLVAGFAKLDDPTQTIGFLSWGFAVPEKAARWLVYLLAVAEILLAAAMVFHLGLRSWPAIAALCVVAFFVGLLVAVALRFPHKPISCGCFGVLQPPFGGASILSQLKLDALLALVLVVHLATGVIRRPRVTPCASDLAAATA